MDLSDTTKERTTNGKRVDEGSGSLGHASLRVFIGLAVHANTNGCKGVACAKANAGPDTVLPPGEQRQHTLHTNAASLFHASV